MNPIKLSKILSEHFTDFEILSDDVQDNCHKFLVYSKDSPKDIVNSLKRIPCKDYYIIDPNKFSILFY